MRIKESLLLNQEIATLTLFAREDMHANVFARKAKPDEAIWTK